MLLASILLVAGFDVCIVIAEPTLGPMRGCVSVQKDFEQWHHVMLRPDPDAIPWPAQHNTGVASVASSVGRGAPSEIGTLGAASMDTAASRSRPVQLRHHAGYNSSTTQELGAFKAAKPLLTGDVQADKDILGFYAAREKVMQGQRVSAAGLRASHDAGVGT